MHQQASEEKNGYKKIKLERYDMEMLKANFFQSKEKKIICTRE